MSHEAKPLHYRDVSKETPCTGCEECVSVCDAGKHTRHAVSGHGCVSLAEPLEVEIVDREELADTYKLLSGKKGNYILDSLERIKNGRVC